MHTKIDTSKDKVINVHIKGGKNIQFKACVEGIFYKNLDDQSMIINTNNVYINTYSYLSTLPQKYDFYWFMKLKERGRFENCNNIFTGQEHQNLRYTYVKER